MEQSHIKHIKLNDLLTLNIRGTITTGEVSEIKAIYLGKRFDDKQHTACVDSVHVDQLKKGLASIQVNGDTWIPYNSILQSAKQPSLLTFIVDKLKRWLRSGFAVSI